MKVIYSRDEIPEGMNFFEAATFWNNHALSEELLEDSIMRETKTIVWKARKVEGKDYYAIDSWSICFPDFDDAEGFLKEHGVDKTCCKYKHDGDRISITVYPEVVDKLDIERFA